MPIQHSIKYSYESEEASISEIARRSGVCWRTAAKYARRSDWNEPMASPKARRRHVMDPVAETVDTWLLEDRLLPRKDRRNAAAIYKELRDKHGFDGSERTIRRYIQGRRGELFKKEAENTAYVELRHNPADGQADFGTIHCVRDNSIVEAKALVLSFPWSNAGFAVPMPSENTECFLEGLKALFKQAGGVPKRLVLDDASTAVVSIGKGESRELTEAFTRFKLHYRFEADFCRPARGNEKGNVENKVGYIRRQWLCPPKPLASFEELGEQLAVEAIKDMDRPHYKHGTKISELWEEEQKALLALPNVPFEAVRIDSAVLNNYAEFRFEKATYSVPKGKPRQKVLLSVFWDRIEVRDGGGEVLQTLPRQYMLKEQPIDWPALFEIYSQKPRAAVNSAMFDYLPKVVRTHLKDADPQDRGSRVRMLRDLLKTYDMTQIAQALEALPADKRDNLATLELTIYALLPENRLPEPMAEGYTPVEVLRYDPDSGVYDKLVPTRAREVAMA